VSVKALAGDSITRRLLAEVTELHIRTRTLHEASRSGDPDRARTVPV
jgi:hypothetical protein